MKEKRREEKALTQIKAVYEIKVFKVCFERPCLFVKSFDQS